MIAMREMGPILVLLLLATAACWYLVFSRSMRDKVQRPAWRLYKLGQEQKEMWDAMYFAAVLVAALAFTIFLAVAFIVTIFGTS